MITKITKAYTRKYSDTKQTVSYVEWVDNKGKSGRTEGDAKNLHMSALLNRACKEGVQVEEQTW